MEFETCSAHGRPFVRIMLTDMSMTVIVPIPKKALGQDVPTPLKCQPTFEHPKILPATFDKHPYTNDKPLLKVLDAEAMN